MVDANKEEKGRPNRIAIGAVIAYAIVWLLLFAVATVTPDEFGYSWIPISFWSVPSVLMLRWWVTSSWELRYEILLGGLCNCLLLYGIVRTFVGAWSRFWRWLVRIYST